MTATVTPTSAAIEARIDQVQQRIAEARARRVELESEIAAAVANGAPSDLQEAELSRLDARLKASDTALASLAQDLRTAQQQEALSELHPLAVALAEARQVHEAANAKLEAAERALQAAHEQVRAARQGVATVEFNARAAAHRAAALGATDEQVHAAQQP